MKNLKFIPLLFLFNYAYANSGMGPWALLWIPFFIIFFTFINCIMIANIKEGSGFINFINFIVLHIIGISALISYDIIIGTILAGIIIFIAFMGIISWSGIKSSNEEIVKNTSKEKIQDDNLVVSYTEQAIQNKKKVKNEIH